MSERKRRSYSEEFKREAVGRLAASGMSVPELARELGVVDSLVRAWVRTYGGRRPAPAAVSTPRLPTPADQDAEIVRLRRENERLRMERDILKKAVVIFGEAKEGRK